jgi:hypothetical protein
MKNFTPMTAAEDQAKRWNSTAGRAWVDAQPQIDRLLKPFEDLLVDAVAARAARQWRLRGGWARRRAAPASTSRYR